MKILIENLTQMGFKIEEDPGILGNANNITLNRDVAIYPEYHFTLLHGKVPHTASLAIPNKNIRAALQHLADNNFKIIGIKGGYVRQHNEFLLFYNNRLEIMVTLTISYGIDGDIVPSKNDESIENQFGAFNNPNEDFATTTLTLLSLSAGIPFIQEFVDKFNHPANLDERGKVLLFEKNEYGELVLNPYKVSGFSLDIDENYNDDFKEVDEKLRSWMGDFESKNNKLVLLHGVPGSGKTNYIKHLLNTSDDVKKIYIPPYFIQSFSDPAFLPIIRKEGSSLLIIEDAEKILVNREEQSDNSTISLILNMCDGIFADIMNLKIIATFNTDEDKIDSALRRRGRLFLKYKFDKLSEEKTRKLYRKVHDDEPPESSMSLAEIYNSENSFGKKKVERSIGFAS